MRVNGMHFRLIPLVAALAGTLVFASAAVGQDDAALPRDKADLLGDSLHDAAMKIQSDPARFAEAARLLQRESKLRRKEDRSAYDVLMLSAHLLHAAGRPMEARQTLETAADRAIQIGDVERAARAYLEASFVAQEEGSKEENQRLAGLAEGLTSSPLLADADRAELRRRIEVGILTEKQRQARTEASARADDMHQKALTLQSDPKRAREAADLHRSEAKLRAVSDPSAVDCLMMAGHLYYADKRLLEAKQALEEAGDRALGAGDVERAARAFLEASFAAQQLGDKAEMERLGRRAEKLVASPLLSDEQRADISRRINRIPKPAQN